MRLHQPCQSRFAGAGGLQEGAGRQLDSHAADSHHRYGELCDDLAVAREPRESMALCNRCKSGDMHRREWSRSAQVDIETGLGRRRLDVEGLARVRDLFGNGPGRGDCAAEAGGEDGAVIDGNNMMRFPRGVSDCEQVAGAAACMKNGAPAPLAVRIDQVVHRRIQPDPRQCLDDKPALPLAVARRGPVLQRATTADAKIRADRCDTLGTCNLDFNQVSAVGVARPLLDRNRLARQRIGHVEGARRRVADAIAESAKSRDGEALSHVRRR
jgi:hypothetical protein